MSRLTPVLAATIYLGSPLAAADGSRFAPMFTDPEFRFQPAFAVIVGGLKPETTSANSFAGAEISFNSGVFQTADRRIRTHVMVGEYNKDALTLRTFEFSPRYTVQMGNGYSVGLGPGLALVRAEALNEITHHVAWGLVTGLNYRKTGYYAGVDLRMQNTNEKRVTGGQREVDNWLLAVKVGYSY